ncbi:MAG: hypothetical protein CSA21_01065 [Deltaproteobacteria bacterium]|nr:MAG: hypothetical protein CSA21_01065 [Deltaproteobacteria bacterium]
MAEEIELQQLEESIGRLLHDFDMLQKEKAQLEETLRAREATIAELRHQLEESGMEKLEIEDRVGRMLQRIVTWEQENDKKAQEEKPGASVSEAAVAAEDGTAESADSSSSHQTTLFKVADESENQY